MTSDFKGGGRVTNRFSWGLKGLSSLGRGLVVSLLIGAVACAGSASNSYERYQSLEHYGYGRSQLQRRDWPVEAHSLQSKIRRRPPWEIWQYKVDLSGLPLTNEGLLAGDQALEANQVQEALNRYKQIRSVHISINESEAMVLRIASTELLLDRPKNALAVISDHFNRLGQNVEAVNPYFSLVVAYAYGRSGDVDQSLAWFSRINQIAGGKGALSAGAAQGVRLLLRSLPEENLLKISRYWATDNMISSLIGQEQRLRSSRDYVRPALTEQAAFWEGDYAERAPVTEGSITGRYRVLALLPLSGSYASLGQSVKGGIEMAVESVASSVQVDFKDVSVDSVSAVSIYQDALANDDTAMVLGPLLAEPSVAVADHASGRLPLMVFSKNDNFKTGEGVFRLGATADSQVSSLLEACRDRLNFKRFALVYPENGNGYLFADVFRQYIAALNLELGYEASYREGAQSVLVKIAKELESRDISAVFVPDNLQAVTALLANISEKERRRLRFLGTAAWDDMTRLSHSSSLLEGAIFVSPFFLNSPRSAIGQFVAAYQSKYNRQPDFLAAQGFDAATLVINAIHKMTSDRLSSLADALLALDVYDGLTGLIYVDHGGEIRRRYSIVELRSGKVTELPEASAKNTSVPFYSWHANKPLHVSE